MCCFMVQNAVFLVVCVSYNDVHFDRHCWWVVVFHIYANQVSFLFVCVCSCSIILATWGVSINFRLHWKGVCTADAFAQFCLQRGFAQACHENKTYPPEAGLAFGRVGCRSQKGIFSQSRRKAMAGKGPDTPQVASNFPQFDFLNSFLQMFCEFSVICCPPTRPDRFLASFPNSRML